MAFHLQPSGNPALVSRAGNGAGAPDQYLLLASDGATRWTTDLATATAFESMREATRAAMRLPSAIRAFGVPFSTSRVA